MSRTIAIIGAGVTGLTCARALADAGREVVVVDKGRGLGGRLATRRVGDEMSFDHGAQYFRAQSPYFCRYVEEACAAGLIAEWTPASGDSTAWVGVSGMSGLAKQLAKGVEVLQSTEITRVERSADRWVLTHADDSLEAGHLVCTVPVVQTRKLLGNVPGVLRELAAVEANPCWALMAAFAEPIDLPDWQRPDVGPLAWIARNSSKPGRPETECWVAHAAPAWSTAHLEDEKDTVARELLAAFETLASKLPKVRHLAAHRWRYATTKTPLGQPFMKADQLHIGGDWCLGARVEDGFESGRAIASDILGTAAECLR